MEPKIPFVITISRQLGSGGAYIGQQLAKKLHVFYADREIISEAAKKLSVKEKELETRDEKALFWQSLIESYAANTDNYLPTQIIVPIDRELFEAESEIIERIAKERSAVIIGRCGSHILRNYPNHISLYFHADNISRIARIRKLYEKSEEAAERMMLKSDKERGRYTHKFTGEDWNDLRLYDLTVNTGVLGMDGTVEL
ncbi:MAG: cytidylate kinase-like family protein, partial [Bacteroidota bacterium]|nr:cytidylate kinase-like family protein [Bacteroidota bacterium]